MIPGLNILNMALTAIKRQTIIYYQFISRVPNDIGQDVTTYAAPVNISGSFQPVPRELYFENGLDLDKRYYTFYTNSNLLDVNRDVSGDQIEFNGWRFQCLSSNNWFELDGWAGVLCVSIQ